MASSYWDSSQKRHWTFTKPELANLRRKLEESERLLVSQFPLPDKRHLSIYFYMQLNKVGKQLSVRQQAIATAQVYIKRFYIKVDIRRTDPCLVAATALYLACKMEECPQHIRLVYAEAQHSWPESRIRETSKIGECEFSLISEMNSQLIIHHPYRSLEELQAGFPLTQDEATMARSVINDHYLTDLPLLHAPHIIAVTAIVLAVIVKPQQNNSQSHGQTVAAALQALNNPKAAPGANGPAGTSIQNRIQKLINWLADSSVDVESVIDSVQELISLYEIWDSYSDRPTKDLIAKWTRKNGLDR